MDQMLAPKHQVEKQERATARAITPLRGFIFELKVNKSV
jgi:hypothetical protein